MKAFFSTLIYGILISTALFSCKSKQNGHTNTKNDVAVTETPEVKTNERTEPLAPEISQPSPSGEILNLSSLKGKMVLVEFWASWCGPCRRSNPELVNFYNEYSAKEYKNASGFEIFSVSLDKHQEDWVDAIAKDGLKWKYHVSDLKAWKSAPARTYGVEAIPTNFLLDEQGYIIGRDLSFAEMGQILTARLK